MVMPGRVLLIVFLVFLVFMFLFTALPLKVIVQADVSLQSSCFEVRLKPLLFPSYVTLVRSGGKRRSGKAAREGLGKPAYLIEKSRAFLKTIWAGLCDIRAIIEELLKGVQIDEFSASGRIGLGDAFETALLCGALSAMSPLIFRLFHPKSGLSGELHRLEFRPVYDHPYASIRLRAVLTVRFWVIFRALYASRKLIRRALMVEY